MKTAKATMGQPEFDEEIRVPRFICRVTRAWHPVKNDEEGLKNLWAGQQKLLEAFDLQFPDQRQPALTVPPAIPTFPALQARPAPPTQALTITPAISPPAGPAPIPISHPLEVLHPKPAQFTNPSQTAKSTPAISHPVAIPFSRGPVGLPPAPPKPTQFEHSQLQPGTSAGTSAKPRVVAPPSRSPSPRYINRFAVLNRDEDADDADESPAPVNKGKGKEVVRGAQKPAPVNVDKGKGKEVVREAEKLPVVKVKRRKLANHDGFESKCISNSMRYLSGRNMFKKFYDIFLSHCSGIKQLQSTWKILAHNKIGLFFGDLFKRSLTIVNAGSQT